MTPRVLIPMAVLLGCALLPGAASARGPAAVTMSSAAFSPDMLGAPTNLLGRVTIRSSGQRLPSPITHVNFYGPAGATLNLVGTRTCSATELENVGPEACPALSRAGSGGGEGLYEIGKQLVREKFTFDVFVGDNHAGHTVLLIYLNAATPVPVHEVFTATMVPATNTYGLGFSVEVPLLRVLPEASYASVSSAFITLGTKNLAYYKTVGGKRRLFHARGITAPKSCPRGGWPV